MYNLTFLNQSNTTIELIQGLSQVTDPPYMLFSTFLLALFIIIFVFTKRYDTRIAFLSASAVTTVIAALLLFIHILPWYIFIFPLIALVASIIINQVT